MRIVLAQINPTLGDISGNTEKILHGIARAKKEKADIVLFPELSICGYPPEDFLPYTRSSEEGSKKEITAKTPGTPRKSNEGMIKPNDLGSSVLKLDLRI